MSTNRPDRAPAHNHAVEFGIGGRLRSMTKVLPEQARAHNRALVLQTLFHSGAMSRADLARSTRLTRVTISDVVAECIADGVVHEVGMRESAGPGKPAILLDIHRQGQQIVGIDLSGSTSFSGAVLDLGGRVVRERSRPLPADVTAEAAYALTRELAQELLSAADKPVLGVGVGSPGVVRSDGLILSAPNLDWQDLPLERLLSEELGVPVVVSNDANAAILAEYTFGEAHSDVMLARIGRGVGAGVIAGGRQLEGARFAAGEIGHVVMAPGTGPVCVCGRQGCLEAWVQVPRLRAEVAAEPANAPTLLADAGERLGAVIAPIVAVLDLSEIVIAGPADLFHGVFLDAVSQALRERTLEGVFDDVVVRLAAQEDIVVRGAAVAVLAAQLGVT